MTGSFRLRTSALHRVQRSKEKENVLVKGRKAFRTHLYQLRTHIPVAAVINTSLFYLLFYIRHLILKPKITCATHATPNKGKYLLMRCAFFNKTATAKAKWHFKVKATKALRHQTGLSGAVKTAATCSFSHLVPSPISGDDKSNVSYQASVINKYKQWILSTLF